MWQIIIGAIGWGIFAIPVLEGVLNLGNAIGLSVFGCLFLWGIFRKKIRAKLPELRKNKTVRRLMNTFCVLFVCICVYFVIGSGFVIKGITNAPPEGTDVVLVLGCRVRQDENPSTTLRKRLDTAIKYLNVNPDAVCIVSGGQGHDEPITEALCMKNYLLKNGIDESRIYTEDKSTSTKENMLFSAEIIRNELGIQEPAVAIATSDYHEFRASITAKEAGLTPYSLPAPSPREMLPTYFVREVFAIPAELFLR